MEVIFNSVRVRMVNPMGLYATALVLGAVGLAGVLVEGGGRLGDPWAVAALAVTAVIAERGRVRLTSNLEESISLLPTLFAAVLFGPLAAMLVGAASTLSDFKKPYLRWTVWTCIRAITGCVAAILSTAAADLTQSDLGAIAIGTTVAALTAEVLDVGFAGLTYRLRGNGEMKTVVRMLAPLILVSVPLYAPLLALLVLAYLKVSPWTLPLFFIPALAAQRVFVLYQEQRQLAQDLSGANDRLERANFSFASALVATLDARDRYTAGHSAAVAIYAKDIAARLGLSEAERQLAHLSGLVHDIGKIGLPPGLLEKSGALTLDERRQMQGHSGIGERILQKVEDYTEIASIVRHHHERWDGEGYPDRIAGDAIPLLSRIIAVADAYNAMTSDRPYRDAMPSRVARMRLAQAVESQFDTSIIAAFEAVLAGASEEYRMGVGSEFTLEAQAPLAEPPAAMAHVA